MKRFFAPIPVIIAILFVASSAYAAVKISQVNRGLSLNWKMDENTGTTLLDSSGGGNSATLEGDTAPGWTDGRFGHAVTFDGSSQYAVSTAPVASLGSVDAPYSISTWVKIDGGETNGNIIHISNNSNGLGWCIPFVAVVDGKFSAISFNGSSVYSTQSDTPSTDVWHNVVTTWSATSGLRLYVDGVLKTTTAQSNFAAAGVPVYVQLARGAPCTADTGFFQGSVDDTKVYSKEISATQVRALYSNNTASIATLAPRTSGLAGQFYVGDNFNTLSSSAVDQTINFDPADDSLGTARTGQSDHFTARWTGYVTPQYSEEYTFYTTSDDGVLLYVDGQLIVDSWVPQGPTEHSGTINLTAGRPYQIRLDYVEYDGGAVVTLSWSSMSTAKDIIPSSALSHGGGTTIVNDSRNSRIAGGLVDLWSFDGPDMNWSSPSSGTALDRSGNSHDATLNNMYQATSPKPGVMGQALTFDGSGSCVTTNENLNGLSAFTVSGWIKPTNAGTRLSFFGQNNLIEFGFYDSSQISAWTQYGNETYNLWYSTGPSFFNKWHHVVFEGDATQESLWIDGVKVDQGIGAVSGYGYTGYNFSIGCGVWDDTGGYFSGVMDDVRVYTSALTNAQIKQLYLMGK